MKAHAEKTCASWTALFKRACGVSEKTGDGPARKRYGHSRLASQTASDSHEGGVEWKAGGYHKANCEGFHSVLSLSD